MKSGLVSTVPATKYAIPFCAPEIRGNEWQYIKECLDSTWVSSADPFVGRFEQMVADYVGAKYGAATSSGTAALHVALLVAGVQPDDEVLVSALTFIAPVNAIRYVGAWPVFIDAEPGTWQMDPQRVIDFLNTECQSRRGSLYNKTTFGGRRHGDELLDWCDSSRNLHNKIRAITDPGPGARTLLGDQEVIVWRAFFDPAWPIYMAAPGEVVGCRPGEGVLVKTGDSTLLVQEAQACNSKARIPSWRTGTRLGTNIFAYLEQLRAGVETLERAGLEAEES